MKEVIIRLIEELENTRKKQQEESYKDRSLATSAYHDGVGVGLLIGIDALKEVLAQHVSDNSRQAADTERNDQHGQKE